jgi:hypothetical protein
VSLCTSFGGTDVKLVVHKKNLVQFLTSKVETGVAELFDWGVNIVMLLELLILYFQRSYEFSIKFTFNNVFYYLTGNYGVVNRESIIMNTKI